MLNLMGFRVLFKIDHFSAQRLMSALGQKQTCAAHPRRSATECLLPPAISALDGNRLKEVERALSIGTSVKIC